MRKPLKQTPSHVQDHIDLVARHEQDFLERRSLSEKIGDAVGVWVGSLTFVLVHVLCFAAWILLNTAHVGSIRHFDPFPFPLLDLGVALEAILLASFIVMRQQRMGRRSDERDHLILQILLLTEKEVTAALGMERQIARKLGVPRAANDEEVKELSQHTSIEEVAEGLKESLTAE
jgi:uncharacterized membrane protein